jgi:hypothetical protein
MKPIDKEFTVHGRTLNQLARSATAAIYEIRGMKNLLYGFEVIRIKVKPQTEVFGRVSVEQEVYPSSSQFGRMGWSFGSNDRKAAFARFDKLAQAEPGGSVVPEDGERRDVNAPGALAGHPCEQADGREMLNRLLEEALAYQGRSEPCF